MKRIILLFLILFVSFAYSASSLKIFEIEETENLRLGLETDDPDADQLTYIFTEPLDAYGEWQTDYGDAGEYYAIITVSDGESEVSEEVQIVVNRKEEKPVIDEFLPKEDFIIIDEGSNIKFKIEASDLNDDELTYTWLQNNEIVSENNEMLFETDYYDSGDYVILFIVSDGVLDASKEWNVEVEDNDRPPKLVNLSNAKVKEGEQLKIKLKGIDPDKDDIIFSVEDAPENSRLKGNVFTWTPDHDFMQKNNAFDYVLEKFRLLSRSVNVIFKAQSNELSDEEKVKITVKDSNRPFDLDIEDIEVNEGEEILIDPEYYDPDNDKVSFSYSGFMGSNKKTTDYDDAGEYVVKVVATDGYFTETMFIDIKVNDVNRKPVFDNMRDIKVFEGEEVIVELDASDPDNDEVSFSAENLPKGAKLNDNLFVWKPDFDVVNGTKKEISVDFIVSDGTDEDKQKARITVLNVNQAPEIIDFSDNLIALENDQILFEVYVVDMDGDELTYTWKFGFFDKYEGSTNQHQRIFTTTGKKKVEVTVSDGIETVSKVWEVEVI